MFSLYSKKCEYVLLGLARLGAEGIRGGRFLAKDFCGKTNLPEPFTRKALQALVKAGILQAVQGPGGGYSFAKPIKQISVLDLIYAIEGKKYYSACVMGFAQCHAARPCGLHAVWTQAKGHLVLQLQKETLSSLVRRTFPSKGAKAKGLKSIK